MKNDVETCLTLESGLTLKSIESIVHNTIKSMCFEEPEKQSIIKASEILAPDFLNILNTYFEIADGVDVNQYPVSLLEVVDGFLNNLKVQVIKHLNDQPVSTGLLLTWIPIVMMLKRSAKDINAFKLQLVTTHLESEVHKFTITHLNHALNKQAKKFNNVECPPHAVKFYKFKHRQSTLN